MNDEKTRSTYLQYILLFSSRKCCRKQKTSPYKHLYSNHHQLRESGLIRVKYKRISHLIDQNIYQPCSKHRTQKDRYSYMAVRRFRSMRALIYAGKNPGRLTIKSLVKSPHCAHRHNLKTTLINKGHLSAISLKQRSKLTKSKKLLSAFKQRKRNTREIGKGEV